MGCGMSESPCWLWEQVWGWGDGRAGGTPTVQQGRPWTSHRCVQGLNTETALPCQGAGAAAHSCGSAGQHLGERLWGSIGRDTSLLGRGSPAPSRSALGLSVRVPTAQG